MLLLLFVAACSSTSNPKIVYQAKNQLDKDMLITSITVFNKGSNKQIASDLPFIVKMYPNQDINLKPSWVWDVEEYNCPCNCNEVDGELIKIVPSHTIVSIEPAKSWSFQRQLPLECIPLKGKFYIFIAVWNGQMINAGELTFP